MPLKYGIAVRDLQDLARRSKSKTDLYVTAAKPRHDVHGQNEQQDDQIQPGESLVKLNIGDEIKSIESAFMAQLRGFFAEIETRFV
jgi:hypothetical protein